MTVETFIKKGMKTLKDMDKTLTPKQRREIAGDMAKWYQENNKPVNMDIFKSILRKHGYKH